MSVDMPYGETKLKLSTGKVIITEKVILSHVRSRVVSQYVEYWKQEKFTACSSRTYMRVLEACGPPFQKCMKDLNNYAADGVNAFEDLRNLTSDVAALRPDGMEWAEIVRDSLTKGKQYIKLNYKIG